MATTLASVISYAQNTGRVVITGAGDSTFERAGAGHFQGMADALLSSYECAGVLVPPNSSSENNETQGYAFARRRLNQSIFLTPMLSADFGLPGYQVTDKQYGFTVPVVGRQQNLATTLNDAGGISSADTTIIVTDGTKIENPNGATSWIQIENEIISYTTLTTNTLTGCTRGVLGTTAASHADGTAVTRASVWQGPVSAYIPGTTLGVGGIADGTTTANIPLTDASAFPVSGRIRLTDGEWIAYTGKSGNSLTGITRNVFGAVSPIGHSAGEAVRFAVGNVPAGLLYPDHPIGVNSEFKIAAWYKSLSASSLTQSTYRNELYSQATPINTDTSYTSLQDGTNINWTGTAVGTMAKTVLTATQASSDRGYLTLNWGGSRASALYGPIGPAVLMWNGLLAGQRPKGFIQAMGYSRGGKCLNTMHYEVNRYDVTNSINEFSKGTEEMYKVFLQCGDADVGGNSACSLMHLCVFGHNETGGQGYGGPVDLTAPWTENTAARTTLASSCNSTDTTISLASNANLVGSFGLVLIDSEYISYESQSGGTLSNCTRGLFGTIPASHTSGVSAYQGYKTVNPLGFAADVLFDYKWRKARWIAAGGTEATFFYAYLRPIPTSSSPTYGDQNSVASGTVASREGRLREFTTAISTYCGGMSNFVVIDLLNVIGGTEAEDLDQGASSSDVIHHTRSFYRNVGHRAVAYYGFGRGSGTVITGLRSRGR